MFPSLPSAYYSGGRSNGPANGPLVQRQLLNRELARGASNRSTGLPAARPVRRRRRRHFPCSGAYTDVMHRRGGGRRVSWSPHLDPFARRRRRAAQADAKTPGTASVRVAGSFRFRSRRFGESWLGLATCFSDCCYDFARAVFTQPKFWWIIQGGCGEVDIFERLALWFGGMRMKKMVASQPIPHPLESRCLFVIAARWK